MGIWKMALASVALVSLVWLLPTSRSASAAQKPTTPPSLEDQNQALRATLAARETEIVELRARLRTKEAELESLRLKQRLAAQTLPFAPQQPFSLAPSNPMPPGSVPQRFNGSTFYLVPLGENVDAKPLKLNNVTIEHEAPTVPISGRGTLLDDRTGTTRELIHGR